MEIRTPIIAIMVTVILLVIYLRRNLPQLISAKVFFGFLLSVFFCNLSEIFQCAVFIYLDETYVALRHVSMVLYVGALLWVAFLMSIYLYFKTSLKRTISNWVVVVTYLPALIATVFAAINGIGYDTSINGRFFGYGVAVDVCYTVGFVYIFLALIRVLWLRKRLPKDDVSSILMGLIIWLALAAYQFWFRELQVSSIAMMLMALILFLSMENPREYYERSIEGIMNRDAFNTALLESFGLKRSLFIASVIFTGKTTVMTGSDRNELAELMKAVGKVTETHIGVPSYLFSWNCLSTLVKRPEDVEKYMNLIGCFNDGESKNYKMTFSILEVPKYAKDADVSIQILSYVAGEYVYTQSSPNLVIDDSVVDKMTFRNTIEDVVRKAVKEKAFDVYYQPILKVADGSFSSAEALVRLRRPETENYISPEDFIPIAEQCGLVQEIDDIVFEKVCSFIAKSNLQSYGIKMIEVNLSGNEVVDEQTHERLINKMHKYHIPPKFINFEITETSYISNDKVFQQNVEKLRAMGSSFSMDDFGSGYSNLLEILKMDYALVKLDKEFVWNCLESDKPENLKMLDYTISFLSDYGLHILAEGVETLDQAKVLIEKGVEYLQGFYYSRPVPEEEFLDFLMAQKGLFSK